LWKKWLSVIRNETTALVMHRHIYKRVQTIIATNPKLHIPSSFYDWMHDSYVNFMVIGIGRLADPNKRSISFVRLMNGIRQFPDVLSRRRFVGLYSSARLRHLGQRDFNRFSSPTAKRINLRIIITHTRQLREAAGRLRRYRNKRIAHRDERSLRSLPTFGDVDACVDSLERLLKEYVLLLEAGGLTQVLPVWQYDWTQIFRMPWIEDDAALKAAIAAEDAKRPEDAQMS
jgi:hypothetical protein